MRTQQQLDYRRQYDSNPIKYLEEAIDGALDHLMDNKMVKEVLNRSYILDDIVNITDYFDDIDENIEEQIKSLVAEYNLQINHFVLEFDPDDDPYTVYITERE